MAFFFSGRAVLGMLRETEAAVAAGSTDQVRVIIVDLMVWVYVRTITR